jgi:hypothetical protein
MDDFLYVPGFQKASQGLVADCRLHDPLEHGLWMLQVRCRFWCLDIRSNPVWIHLLAFLDWTVLCWHPSDFAPPAAVFRHLLSNLAIAHSAFGLLSSAFCLLPLALCLAPFAFTAPHSWPHRSHRSCPGTSAARRSFGRPLCPENGKPAPDTRCGFYPQPSSSRPPHLGF